MGNCCSTPVREPIEQGKPRGPLPQERQLPVKDKDAVVTTQQKPEPAPTTEIPNPTVPSPIPVNEESNDTVDTEYATAAVATTLNIKEPVDGDDGRGATRKRKSQINMKSVARMKFPLELMPVVAKYLDLDTFLALRLCGLAIYRVLTPELWRYVHFDIRQVSGPGGGYEGTECEWPVTKRVGMPNELWQGTQFIFEDRQLQRYIRLDWQRLHEFTQTILRGRLSRALREVRHVSIFLVPQTPIAVGYDYVQFLKEMPTKSVMDNYNRKPVVFVDALLAKVIPRYLPAVERFDVVLRGTDAYNDGVLSELMAPQHYPNAQRHLQLHGLTGLYYSELSASNLKSLVLTISSTIWTSVQRTFKQELPVLPSTLEYLELNRKWIPSESKMPESPLTDERMAKLVSRATRLKTLKVHTHHELDTFEWVPQSVTDLSIDDGDENPQYITRSSRVDLPNVAKFSVTTPYGAIFKKIQFTNLRHLQVGDLDNCEVLGPVIATNPNLSTLLMGESEGTGPVWSVMLRNAVNISTLVIEGEPDVFDKYSNPAHLKLQNLDTVGLTVLSEPEQVDGVVEEVLRRTPRLQRFFLRCEKLDEEHWGRCIINVDINEVDEYGNEYDDDGDGDDEDSMGGGDALQTYIVNVPRCKVAFGI